MDKNLKIAQAILEKVGGKDNVKEVFNCATRLRFSFNDESKVDEDAIKKIDGILGVVQSGGMYQIVIGQNVETVYEHLCALGNIKKESSIDENLDENLTEENKFSFKKIINNIFTYLVGSLSPIIYLILGAALWTTVGSILGPGVLNIITTESPFYVTTTLVYNAVFYFLPIYIGYTAAKTLKIPNPAWGMLIGGLTIVPSFVSMVGTVETFSIFGLVAVPVANYSSTILPVLMGVWVFSYLYKISRKIIPDLIFGTVAPFILIFIMSILMLAVFAPLGTYIGNLLSSAFMWMYNSIWPIKVLGYVLLTALWPVITLAGMHLPIFMTAFAIMLQNGSDPFTIVCAATSVWVCYGMALGAAFKFKKKENKTAALSAFIAGFFGAIVEPSLYSVALKSKSALRVMIAGGAIVGVVLSIIQPTYNNLGSGNIIGAFAAWSGSTINLAKGLGGMALALVIGALGVILFAKFDEDAN